LNRADFQALTQIRLEEADILLAAGKYEGAYYLAGYAVECALKACIAKLTGLHDFPPKDTSNSYYTHNLDKLLTTAQLRVQLESDRSGNPQLDAYWTEVLLWNEGSRYLRKSPQDAQGLLQAITDPTN